MPRSPRRAFKLTEQEITLLKDTFRGSHTNQTVRDAAVIILVSVDTPSYESVAKILDIDKREVDRAQKAFLAGGINGIQNLTAPGIILRREQFRRRRTALVAKLREKTADLNAAPRSQRELAGTVGLSKDHVRKILKKAGLAVPSPYSDTRLGKSLRQLLQTAPQKHGQWTYQEVAKALGVDRSRIRVYCKRFGIVFPRKRGDALRNEIVRILKGAPQLRPFWTDVELGHLLNVSRVQAKTYRLKFGIALPPHPLEARIRAELGKKPRAFPRWTYLELGQRLGISKAWIREFCLKKGLALSPT